MTGRHEIGVAGIWFTLALLATEHASVMCPVLFAMGFVYVCLGVENLVHNRYKTQ